MATFEGHIWLLDEPDGAVEASLEVTSERILLSSSGSEIGRWTLDEVTVTQRPDGYHILAEGEELMFQTPDEGLIEAIGGEASIASRIRAATADATSDSDEPAEASIKPDPPPPSTPNPTEGSWSSWWKARQPSHKVVIIAAAALVLLGIGSALGDSGESPDAPINSGADTTEVVAADPVDQPPPATSADTGDWSSTGGYINDVVDTADKMSTLMGTVSEVSFDVADGNLTLAQFSLLMDTAIESAESHRDHFRGTEAPEGFQTSHGHLLSALELFVEAFELAQAGADEADIGMIERAANLMTQGSEQIDLATAALPGQ